MQQGPGPLPSGQALRDQTHDRIPAKDPYRADQHRFYLRERQFRGGATLMPVRPENRDRYPKDFPAISQRIRFERAAGRCECRGQCGRPVAHLEGDGRCRNRHGQPAHGTGSRVVLTTAHLDHTPENCDPENLLAMCQGCHLHYDREHHAATRARTRTARDTAGMDPLF